MAMLISVFKKTDVNKTMLTSFFDKINVNHFLFKNPLFVFSHIHSHLLTQSLTHPFLSKIPLSSFATSTPPSSSPSTLTLKSSTAFNLPLLATSLDAHDDIVYRYNVHANLIEPNLSLGKGCFEDNRWGLCVLGEQFGLHHEGESVVLYCRFQEP